jgi:hypothetical protein
MKTFRSLFVLSAIGLAVLTSGCATSKPAAAQRQPVTVADVESLAKAGMSDDVIISQIKNSGTFYHLAAADIIALHAAGVSNTVIQYMITTTPPPTASAQVPVAPACYPAYYPYPCFWWPPVSFAFRFR